MTADNAQDPAEELEPTIFSAVITPHRSLGHAGFLVLMGIFGAVSFIAGMAFLIDGAWPVFGFFGLDVLLLYWAFRLNYRHAGAYEEVKVTPSTLTVRKVSHRGRAREWVLNPLWVKLDKVVHEEYGIERLFLIARAITPPGRVRRFDTRFFTADASTIAHSVEGVIHAEAELVELVWVEIGSKPLADLHPMTKNVLGELEKRLATGPLRHDAPVPFFHFYGGKMQKDVLGA